MATFKSLVFCCLIFSVLAGCDQLGIETPDKVAARQEAEGKAVGGACRHAGRALEDCYTINRKASKAAVYAGWRDMDGYMRENNIAVVKPGEEEEGKAAASNSNANSNASESKEGAKKTAESGATAPVAEKSASAVHRGKPAKAATKTS
jgi:hypothetical protein